MISAIQSNQNFGARYSFVAPKSMKFTILKKAFGEYCAQNGKVYTGFMNAPKHVLKDNEVAITACVDAGKKGMNRIFVADNLKEPSVDFQKNVISKLPCALENIIINVMRRK